MISQLHCHYLEYIMSHSLAKKNLLQLHSATKYIAQICQIVQHHLFHLQVSKTHVCMHCTQVFSFTFAFLFFHFLSFCCWQKVFTFLVLPFSPFSRSPHLCLANFWGKKERLSKRERESKYRQLEKNTNMETKLKRMRQSERVCVWERKRDRKRER